MSNALINTIAPNGVTDTDGHWQAWVTAIINNFTNAGWLRTSDTGQINEVTTTRPLAANTFQGFAVLQMNDSLQSTKPVFVRIDFGSNAFQQKWPALKIQVAQGSNGSGTLTGALSTQEFICAHDADDSTPRNCPSSGDTNRIMQVFFINSSSNMMLGFSIERTKNTDGTDSNEGILFSTWGKDAGISTVHAYSIYLFTAGAWTRDTISNMFTPANATTGVLGVKVATFPQFPRNGGTFMNPGMNYLCYYNGDVTQGTQSAIPVYGATPNYYFLGAAKIAMTAVARGSIANTGLCMRYE